MPTLTCVDCGTQWHRPARSGPPPQRCTPCRKRRKKEIIPPGRQRNAQLARDAKMLEQREQLRIAVLASFCDLRLRSEAAQALLHMGRTSEALHELATYRPVTIHPEE